MNGYINILKPPGMTSSDVVVFLRRALKPDKIGHAGTLDPDAAGVLPIMLGKATRLFDCLNSGYKEYVAEFTFGIETDTLDASGKITGRNDKEVSAEEIINALPAFSGAINQTPPMVSAININGERAYKLAREEKMVDIPSREVIVHSFSLIRMSGYNKFIFKIACSKGTYIRSLCCDVAKSMGTCAYVSFLLRTKSGYFDIDNSISMNHAIDLYNCGQLNDQIIPLDKPIEYLPRIDIDNSDYTLAINGGNIKAPLIFEGSARAYCNNRFLGLCKVHNNNSDNCYISIYKVLVERG